MSENSMTQKDFTTLKTIGDGNCLFRSIIQSLLIQGLRENKKTWVIEFINGRVQRTEEDLRSNGMEIDPTYITVLQDNPDIIDHIDAFIEQYKNLSSPEQQDLFVKTYFDSDKSPVLYYLSACLRKDIHSHLQETEANENTLEDFAVLNRYAASADCTSYFAKHKIRAYFLAGGNRDSEFSDYGSAYEGVTDWNIHIYLKHTGEGHSAHYDALLLTQALNLNQAVSETDAEKLPPEEIKPISEQKQTIKPDQTLAEILQNKEESETLEKELQIEEDKAIAKNLQMEEIVCFSEKFKSSGNKNNLSFISDVIRGLGLEKELGAEQLSHLQALQNSTTIEQVIQSLQSVINELGYSSQFKEQIQGHSFFSTCGQEVTDMTQTLNSAPAIKCN